MGCIDLTLSRGAFSLDDFTKGRINLYFSFSCSTSWVFSYDRDSTFNVFVGKGQLIAGMDQALVGMCVNERRFVKIPPKLAYGSEGVCKFCSIFVNVSADTTRTFEGRSVKQTRGSAETLNWGEMRSNEHIHTQH